MTDVAQHSIVFGGETFAFQIERTARRKTVAISVGFDGVRVLAPADLDDDRVLGIVRKKGAWLLRKQAAYRELGGQPVAKEFVSGETFHYLGRQYRLKLIPDETAVVTRIAARGSTLVAPVLPNGHASVQRTAVHSGLRHWYRAHAVQHFPVRARMIAALAKLAQDPLAGERWPRPSLPCMIQSRVPWSAALVRYYYAMWSRPGSSRTGIDQSTTMVLGSFDDSC